MIRSEELRAITRRQRKITFDEVVGDPDPGTRTVVRPFSRETRPLNPAWTMSRSTRLRPTRT